MKTQNMNKNQTDLEDWVDNHKHKSPMAVCSVSSNSLFHLSNIFVHISIHLSPTYISKHPNIPYSNLITKRPQLIVFCKEALVGLGVLWLCVIGPFVQLYGVVVEVLIFIWVSSVWALVAVGCVAAAEVEEDWESQLVFSREVKNGF